MTTAKTEKKTTNLQPAIKELHRAFDMANKILFGNNLPQVVITMNTRGKRKGVLGWFTVNPAWQSGEDEYHEINITPEAMNRDYIEIIQTLVHEMIHLHCSVNSIKDTSRNGAWHNKKFLEEAEKHGFEYLHDGPDKRIGYSAITFTSKTVGMVKCWNIDKSAFTISRKEFGDGEGKPKKKSNIIKWCCPSCGDIIRSSKPNIKAFCMNDENKDGTPKDACAVMFEPVLS
ncbi:SprT-like domain-containing protein [Priestia megaterium]|uniref:SprT-like domain-containing protein n=1 Tax=Priestia megaterium TaxID=1404 RepID=UPI0023DA37DC|nr:SprT-like domain-containing protein [Priestia megaterium]MDF2010221.1 SprT-like domain-containing protein [Priestia megaterium]